MRRGEDGTSRRREGVRDGGVEPEQSVRMAGAEEHGPLALGGCLEPLREGVERDEGSLRVNHIMATCVPRIARNSALVGHEIDQIPLVP